VLLASYLLLISAAASGLVTPDPGKGAKPVQVEFDAPAGCSGADAFFSSLRSRTDELRQSDGNEPHTTIQVRLTRTRGRVLGELRVVDDRGGTDTRKVQGASCDDVVEALSLTAALAVDPNALLSAPASAPVPTATAAPGTEANVTSAAGNPPAAQRSSEAVPPPPADTLHATAARAPRYVPWFELGAGAVGTILLTSSASPGVEVSSRWTLAGSGVMRITLGLALAHVRNDIAQSPGPLQVSLTELLATACPLRLSASVLTIQPCALVVAGWLSASGREAAHTYDVGHPWLGAGAVLHLSTYIGDGLSADLDGGISAPLFKRRYYSTTPDNVVGETPSVSPLVSLGLSYGF
jgi:hypothetical protein